MSNQQRRIKLHNSPSAKSGPGRRALAIGEQTVALEFVLAKETKFMSADLKREVYDFVLEAVRPKFDTPVVTSGETLQSWGSSNDANRPYLGEVVAANIPVTCIGMPVNDRTLSVLENAGYNGQNRKHERAFASGLTYGTLFMKRAMETAKDGTRTVKSVSFCAVSNNLLELFVGPLNSKTYVREVSIWPKQWVRSDTRGGRNQSHGQRKPNNGNRSGPSGRKGNPVGPHRKGEKKKPAPQKAKRSSIKGVSTIQQALKVRVLESGEQELDWKSVTVTMLRAALKEVGLASAGNKAELQSKLLDFAITNDFKLA